MRPNRTPVYVCSLFQVNYVDFGNSEVLPLSAVRQEIPFIDVPRQCLQFVLRDIEPVRHSLFVVFI